MLAPPHLPLHRTRAEQFDTLVMDAVDELETRWAAELAGLEFAVEEVPPAAAAQGGLWEFDAETIIDRGVALGRLFRTGVPGIEGPVIVVYRRPVEARTVDRDDRSDLVFMVVAELVAEFLGKDVEEIDPT